MIYHNNYENMSLWQILETFSHYQQDSFAFYCAKEVESLVNDPRIIDCNLAVERWLNGDKSVDLIIARNNVDNNSLPAWSAWYAACAAICTCSCNTYCYSAYSAITNAADAKAYHLCPNYEQREINYNKFFDDYYQIAQNWLSHWQIPNFPKDDPDFPIFDFLIDMNLISYLLPKKDNLYYLNLNGFDIKHVNEAELLKEIDTMHIKTILRRIINNDSAS